MKSLGVRIGIITLIVAGGFIYNIFFVDTDEVIKFNDKLVAMIGKNDLRFTDISKELTNYNEGKSVDVEKIKRLKDKIKGEIKQIFKCSKL